MLFNKEVKPEYVDNSLDIGADADHDNAVALASTYVPGSEEEKRLVRKIDRRLVPCIWGLYSE